MRELYIASDHGGFELKQRIIEFVTETDEIGEQWQISDLGPFELDPSDDYPDFAFTLAEKVASTDTMGVLICRSGNGMAIAANKVDGVRAALCFSVEHAIKAREHDHANVLVLDADYLDWDTHREIISAFLATGEDKHPRHERRVDKISDYEITN